MTKKCVVVDLDNTLWGGIIGEDGMSGIALSHQEPGASFIAFQQALRDLIDRGVILAINSRNTPEVAWEAIKTHPNMILKEPHFAAARINWGDKVENMRSLAQELRLGLDSMVFLDDDPLNRSAMRALLPEVETPELPHEPAEYARFLRNLPYFPAEATTDEDRMRANLYVTERLRIESERAFATKQEFLGSLRLELKMFEDDAYALARISQLTEKTNQFNTNKVPMTEEDLRRAIAAVDEHIFYAQLSDRFGDSGIVIFAHVKAERTVWRITSLLMSCRVLGRNVEDAFLSEVARRGCATGAKELIVDFVETSKNIPAAEFLSRVIPLRRVNTDALAAPSWVRIL